MAKRNPMARVLSFSVFRKRVVKPKKGRGSYSRKKHGS
jgi:stalled ribosome alternative rescue factor ArfA